MNFPTEANHRRKVEEFQRRHRLGIVTLLFTDMVGSVDLKQRLGDLAGADLIKTHHAALRELLATFPEAEEIDRAGDSFFVVFTRPSDAAKFSLLLHERLRELNLSTVEPVTDRVGVHIGEVVIDDKDGGERDLYGIQVDTCARVMSLAAGGQTLLTRGAFDNARQVLKGQDLPRVGSLTWLNHGPYRLKGLEDPIEICEVGETAHSPLVTPKDSPKAHRFISPDAEPVLGWRPSIGQVVPHTRWILEQQLGEGGFGEVWVARHETLEERRVFKFCFRADRVRSLKREMTLFKLLKDRFGDHPNIVGIQDVFLESPPFYLIMDYAEAQDLRAWCAAQGGPANIPLADRLEIVAQICDALLAAHTADILHRDIKPSNILISRERDGKLRARLTDFGIGQIVSQEAVSEIKRLGFTETVMGANSTRHSGSQMYMAPELLAGKPASKQSDIYSLGVVLFQLIIGDLTKPLTTDWPEEISDPLLRDDLKHCFAGNPDQRFSSVAELAANLRLLPRRHQLLEEQKRLASEREAAAYRRGVLRTRSIAAAVAASFAALALFSFYKADQETLQRQLAIRERDKATISQQKAEEQRERAEAGEKKAQDLVYVANMHLLQSAWEQNNLGRMRELLDATSENPRRGFEWYYWQRQVHLELKAAHGEVASN
jgi:class 3 adenylate cyclase